MVLMRGEARHRRRGTEYSILGGFRLMAGETTVSEDERLMLVRTLSGPALVRSPEGPIRASSVLQPGRSVCVYVGGAGDMWARDYAEFLDGRFDLGTRGHDHLTDDAVRSYLRHALPRTDARSERVATLARMVVVLAHALIVLREGS